MAHGLVSGRMLRHVLMLSGSCGAAKRVRSAYCTSQYVMWHCCSRGIFFLSNYLLLFRFSCAVFFPSLRLPRTCRTIHLFPSDLLLGSNNDGTIPKKIVQRKKPRAVDYTRRCDEAEEAKRGLRSRDEMSAHEEEPSAHSEGENRSV